MPKFICLVALAALVSLAVEPVAAQNAVPDLRGTWKGDSESIVAGGAHPHHPGQTGEPRFDTVPFTLTIDKQNGRRLASQLGQQRDGLGFFRVSVVSNRLLVQSPAHQAMAGPAQ